MFSRCGRLLLLSQSILWFAPIARTQTNHRAAFDSGGRPVTFSWSDADAVERVDKRVDRIDDGISRTAGTDSRLAQMGWKWSEEKGVAAKGYRVVFDHTGAWGILTGEIVANVTDAVDFSAYGLQIVRDLDFSPGAEVSEANGRTLLLTASDPTSAIRQIAALKANERVRYAHPNFVFELEPRSGRPTEAPLFGRQWNLRNSGQTGGRPGADIGIETAWSVTEGDPSVIVADIDLGFEQSHHAMTGAWFVNRGEIPANGIDDDHNGLKDDVSGWNFAINGTNLIYGAANKHGTATAGIIGSRAGGQGTVGICPHCLVLPLVIDETHASAIAAFNYARAAGASVISNSWGYAVGTPSTDGLVEAIRNAAEGGRGGKGMPIVFAMGNFARNDCRSTNPDISSLRTVIAVSATDHNDEKVGPSGNGPCLAIVAPSSGTSANGIPTVDRVGANGYNGGGDATNFLDPDFTNTFYGTSAAAPQVAGVLALMVSARPDANRAQLVQALLGGADKVSPGLANYDSGGRSLLYGYGRLNAGRAVSAVVALEHE